LQDPLGNLRGAYPSPFQISYEVLSLPEGARQRAESVGISLVKEFTSLYQQARFSGHGEFTGGLKKMDQILMQLRK